MSVILSLSSAALLLAASASPAPAGPSAPAAVTAKAPLPWIEDDYPRAIAEAKRRGVPLFVEAWAPW